MAGEREPQAVTGACVGDKPTEGVDDDASSGRSTTYPRDATVLVGEDDEVGILKAEFGGEEVVDKGDVADTAT